MTLMQLVRRGSAAALVGLASLAAQAQAFPHKLMTMIVPYPAGGASDFVARQIQPELTRLLGQQIIVDNVGGVSGALGIQRMLAAPADGHTLTLASPMELIMAPLALSAVKFKPEDLRVAGMLVNATMILVARKDLPADHVDDLVALARKPGAKELSYGSVGPGSMYHLVAEHFCQQAGVRMLHVPYKGMAPVLNDLMGGQIDLVFLPLAGGVPALIREGKVKAIGIASRQPHPLFPKVPTLTSSKALENFEYDLWAGIVVPRSTPDAVVERLHAAIDEALKNEPLRKAYESTGNEVFKPTSLAELDRRYKADVARYQAIAKSINLQLQ